MECTLNADYDNLNHGKVIKRTYYYADRMIFYCDDNYVVKDEEVTCLADHTWSKEPECVPTEGMINLALYPIFTTRSPFSCLPVGIRSSGVSAKKTWGNISVCQYIDIIAVGCSRGLVVRTLGM